MKQFFLYALTSLSFLLDCAHAAEFKLGAAAVRITPERGTPMAGYYKMRLDDGVLDDLFAKAIVVEQDGAKAAFVALDMITVTRPIVVAARKIIAEQTRIPGERVMISATHTHTGPVLPRESNLDEFIGGKTDNVLQFATLLPQLIARCVAEANQKLAPARASVAIGKEENLSFNRRYVMQDGSVMWNPPKFDPKVVRPAGPIDPDVGVIFFESSEKTPAPLATYVNFAMHPDTVGGTKISGDYPAALTRRLAENKGPEMLTFFANGCCGNINHRNINWTDPQKGSPEAERIGTVLAAAVFKALPNLKPVSTHAPRVRSEMVQLPLPKFSDAEAAEARATILKLSDPKVSTQAKAKAVCVLDVLAREGKPLEVEVQAVSFGEDLAIVSLPGEIFTELGLELKKNSPFKNTFIAELSNGSIGYIPNRPAYAEGNYEVVSARCGEGSGEMLVQSALKLLKELREQAK